jgi:hypothetical protein
MAQSFPTAFSGGMERTMAMAISLEQSQMIDCSESSRPRLSFFVCTSSAFRGVDVSPGGHAPSDHGFPISASRSHRSMIFKN